MSHNNLHMMKIRDKRYYNIFDVPFLNFFKIELIILFRDGNLL